MANRNEELAKLRYVNMKQCLNELEKELNALNEEQKRLEEEVSLLELEHSKKEEQQKADGAPMANVSLACGGGPAPIQQQPGAIGALIENVEEKPKKFWRMETSV